LENIPEIEDVNVYTGMLKVMGVTVARRGNGRFTIDGGSYRPDGPPPQDLVKRMRASIYLMGACLGRFGRAEVSLPGGCDIGQRPIDQHLKGFRALGAQCVMEEGLVRASAPAGLKGASIYLDVVSVGATINIMLAAVLAQGTTVIENAAKEPHIVDLANFLNAAGGRVQGAGTDVIRIRGVEALSGCNHAIIFDEIQAATYMIAAVATRGDVILENVIPKHLDPISAKIQETGAEIIEDGDTIRVSMDRRPRAVNIKTLPYPGFPTDAQQPMSALLSVAEGTSYVSETIWEGRFKHFEELRRMGTNVRIEGQTAIIEGVRRLTGAAVRATDLRAGAALLVAGLMAEGETEISGIEHIDRGYERAADKLTALGAVLRHESE
jgi:UDP-N-acetylglucosamine 1-carboxyvinyltransferase